MASMGTSAGPPWLPDAVVSVLVATPSLPWPPGDEVPGADGHLHLRAVVEGERRTGHRRADAPLDERHGTTREVVNY